MLRKPFIAGNWKMNKTPMEAAVLANELKEQLKGHRCEVAVCVPFVDIASVADALKGSGIGVGAQNVHWAASGAFTGEISADMLKACGATYVVIGHSERRQFFGETDESVNKRTNAALAAGLTPIVCVGELLAERESGNTFSVVERQTVAAFAGVAESDVQKVVIAYEPVWAIGTGRTATDEQAEEVVAFIRKNVGLLYGEGAAGALRIQYGGSMNAANAQGLMGQPNIDGGLIGGASLKAPDFAAIVKAADSTM